MKPYCIDPVLISLEKFMELTASRRLLPGRVVLQEQMEERFSILKKSGTKHLGDLLKLLASKSKIERFSIQTGLPTAYLVLLKREAGSYLARHFPLSNFPGIPFEYVELLKSGGIINTRDFFEQLQTEEQQKDLSAGSGIPEYRLKELYSLCDLSRITGVGGIFARILYEAGTRSVEEYVNTDPSTQLKKCLDVIEKYGYAAGNLGEDDIRYGINYARVVLACDKKTK